MTFLFEYTPAVKSVIADLKIKMATLSPEQRLDVASQVMGDYCKWCGHPTDECGYTCMRDE